MKPFNARFYRGREHKTTNLSCLKLGSIEHLRIQLKAYISQIDQGNFAVLKNPFAPKLADKQAIEDELNIDGGKHILACL